MNFIDIKKKLLLGEDEAEPKVAVAVVRRVASAISRAAATRVAAPTAAAKHAEQA